MLVLIDCSQHWWLYLFIPTYYPPHNPYQLGTLVIGLLIATCRSCMNCLHHQRLTVWDPLFKLPWMTAVMMKILMGVHWFGV